MKHNGTFTYCEWGRVNVERCEYNGNNVSANTMARKTISVRMGGIVGVEVKKNMERFTNLRVILAQGPC